MVGHRCNSRQTGAAVGRPVSEPLSIVITGASRGLGLASAAHMYKRGWRVVAAMRSPESGLSALQSKTGAAVDDSRLIKQIY